MAKSEYLTEYDEIVNIMQMYIDGCKQGRSQLMRPAFHTDASFFGYAGNQLAIGTKFLFDWRHDQRPLRGAHVLACYLSDALFAVFDLHHAPPAIEVADGFADLATRKQLDRFFQCWVFLPDDLIKISGPQSSFL